MRPYMKKIFICLLHVNLCRRPRIPFAWRRALPCRRLAALALALGFAALNPTYGASSPLAR